MTRITNNQWLTATPPTIAKRSSRRTRIQSTAMQSESVALRCDRLSRGLVKPLARGNGCDGLPLFAAAWLHKCSMVCKHSMARRCAPTSPASAATCGSRCATRPMKGQAPAHGQRSPSPCGAVRSRSLRSTGSTKDAHRNPEAPRPRGRLAEGVELVVGQFDLERGEIFLHMLE
jgi:hypothetical protein